MLKLDIQLFGGRGASSSNAKLEPTKTNVHNKSIDNMIKKYGNIISQIDKDDDPYWAGGGYWITLRDGYASPEMDGGRTIHEANVNDVMKLLKNVRKATKEERKMFK